MAYEQVLLEKDGPAAIITLNRPEKLNAFTNQLGRELADAIRACDADDDVRGIIITGAGRHFCAGADISDGADAFDTKSGSGAKNFGTSEPGKSRDGAGFIGAMYACQKPLIAAFNGAAVGVGITMMLPTDIKIASEKAKFGFVFAQRGLPPEAGSAWFLPQLVGLPQALRWSLSGRVFDAAEADPQRASRLRLSFRESAALAASMLYVLTGLAAYVMAEQGDPDVDTATLLAIFSLVCLLVAAVLVGRLVKDANNKEQPQHADAAGGVQMVANPARV